MTGIALADVPKVSTGGTSIKSWRPFPRQELFMQMPWDEVLFGGAKGPGKTDALLYLAATQVAIPDYRALLLRRTYPKLQEIIDRSQIVWRNRAQWNGSMRRWSFPSGAIIQFGHCQNEDDKYNYQGHEYQFIGFDQLEEFTETQYLYLCAQCRGTNPQVRKMIRATANPGNVGHAWVKARFIDKLDQHGLPKWFLRQNDEDIESVRGDQNAMSRAFISSTLVDNPALLKNDPQYLSKLQQLPVLLQRAFIDGDWDVFAGQFLPMWRRSIHVVSRMPALTTPATRFLALDYGYKKPSSVGWYLVLPSRRIVRYRELYQEGLTYDQLAREILRRCPDTEQYAYIVADPAIWGDRQHHYRETHAQEARGESGAQTMQEVFGSRLQLIQADNRRVVGWNRLREFLEPYQDAEGKTVANFMVTEDCVNFIRTVPGLVHSETRPEDCDSDGEDHCFAAGTKVIMRDGIFNIETLMDKSGDVLTPHGWCKFRNVRMTRKMSETVRLTFDNGENIICTPDHKFFAPGGFIEAENMLGNEVRYANMSYEKEGILCTSKLSARQSSDLMGKITTGAVDISKKKEKDYTSWFGNISMEKSRRDFTSTILMETQPIIPSIIYRRLFDQNTKENTAWKMRSGLKSSNHLQSERRRYGIKVNREYYGTRSIMLNVYVKNLPQEDLHTIAGFVAGNLKPRSVAEKQLNSVQINANLHGEGNNSQTTLKKYAPFAENRIFQTNIVRAKHAQENADQYRVHYPAEDRSKIIRCIKIQRNNNQDVYCLSVIGPLPCFAVGNGLFVHNCADESRYAVMTMHDVPDLPPPPQTPGSSFWNLVREDQRRHGRAHLMEPAVDGLSSGDEIIGDGDVL